MYFKNVLKINTIIKLRLKIAWNIIKKLKKKLKGIQKIKEQKFSYIKLPYFVEIFLKIFENSSIHIYFTSLFQILGKIVFFYVIKLALIVQLAIPSKKKFKNLNFFKLKSENKLEKF